MTNTIIDGMSYFHRMYWGIPELSKNKWGQNINALFQFMKLIKKLTYEETGGKISIAGEGGQSIRKTMSDTYKKERKPLQDNFLWQLHKCKEIWDILGIKSTKYQGYEGDDIIGNIIMHGGNKQWTIWTGDKDMNQLLQGDRVKIYNLGKKCIYTESDFVRDWGFEPHKIIDYLAIIGDSSDGVMGIKGLGEKSVIPLIIEWGTVETIYENIESIKDSIQKKLQGQKDMVLKNKSLIQLMPIEGFEYHQWQWDMETTTLWNQICLEYDMPSLIIK